MQSTQKAGKVPPFIQHVWLRNYKSIASCDIRLSPLTFLVGPNGSGKSNFLDALSFVRDAVDLSLDHAVRERGGVNQVRRRSGGHPNHFEIKLGFSLPDASSGIYAFRIGAMRQGEYEVQHETCEISLGQELRAVRYRVERGTVVDWPLETPPPPAASDRLYLVNAAGHPFFRSLYRRLSSMGFYNLNPDEIRKPQPSEAGDLLRRDGSNIAHVLRRLSRSHPPVRGRIEELLGKIVPGIAGVSADDLGTHETLEFRQVVAGARSAWRFPATNMSDGTLRALGILVALFQASGSLGERQISLVGIEEPESALHPAAAGILRDSLMEASAFTQVLVTSHSPDLLDDKDIGSESILAVRAEDGVTLLGRMDLAGRSMLKQKLYSAGELLRLNQVIPEAGGLNTAANDDEI